VQLVGINVCSQPVAWNMCNIKFCYILNAHPVAGCEILLHRPPPYLFFVDS